MSTLAPLKLSAPEYFDGTHTHFRSWIRQLNLYLRGRRVTDDEGKILTALSYMKGGAAEIWAERFVRERGDSSYGSWDDFVASLRESFTDHTAERRARDELDRFTQDRLGVDEFFNRLESLFSDAAMTTESEKIRAVERATNKTIIDQIYVSGNLPTTYDDYRRRVLNIGRLWERRRAQTSYSNRFAPLAPSAHPPPRPAAPAAPTPRAPPPPAPQVATAPTRDRSTGTGTVFGGAGRPMDVDKVRRTHRCYECGEVGHFRRDCPHPRRQLNVKAVLADFTSEELGQLLEQLTAPREDDDAERVIEEDFCDNQ
jgi:Retrotransposon gag protein/Zinc knuckle